MGRFLGVRDVNSKKDKIAVVFLMITACLFVFGAFVAVPLLQDKSLARFTFLFSSIGFILSGIWGLLKNTVAGTGWVYPYIMRGKSAFWWSIMYLILGGAMFQLALKAILSLP